MNDTPEILRGRRRAGRKGAKDARAPSEPAVRALIEQALHPEAAPVDSVIAEDHATGDSPANASTAGKRNRKRRRAREAAHPTASVAAATAEESSPPVPDMPAAEVPAADVPVAETRSQGESGEPSPGPSIYDRWRVVGQASGGNPQGEGWGPHDVHDAHAPDDAPGDPRDGRGPPPPGGGTHGTAVHPAGHRWVYLAVAVFLLAIGFGLWGVWTAFFAGADLDDRSAAALRARGEKLSQEVSTLRRSDQISRDANRDLERTLAERDEEIAGLRADIAFYERFVGATGQRRGLSVHDLEMRLQGGDAWHFVATLTQNVNRGAVNSGRITLALEGTRNDKLERLSWSTLRKQTNAPGLGYSFKYFQQVEGEVMLPAGFKPLRVTVRLVPEGGSAVEQSFPWPETMRSAGG
ncbi:DUF6776 family protein [Lysobacter hankyongensis]|uniref:DUF3426 domain-containing protein n=1 Tax=Lysobacter hankyongensis TaxID=1176535 RepID=A0ABP9AXX6_9GAMM